MKIDKYGSMFLTEDEAFAALYSGKISNFEHIFLDNSTVDQLNRAIDQNKDHFSKVAEFKEPTIDLVEFDKNHQKSWFMPEDYCPNLIEYIYGKCKTKEEINRVSEELELFVQHGMLDLLFYLKYLVDTMRENNIVWGVGRGSSVASFVLYLIGVHKVNSLKYNLDIKEFLK